MITYHYYNYNYYLSYLDGLLDVWTAFYCLHALITKSFNNKITNKSITIMDEKSALKIRQQSLETIKQDLFQFHDGQLNSAHIILAIEHCSV